MHHPTDKIAHTTAFVTPVVEHWLEREIAQWVHAMKDRSDDPSHHERTLLPRHVTGKTDTHLRSKQSSTWPVSILPSAGKTADAANLHLCHTGLLGEILAYLSWLRTPYSKILNSPGICVAVVGSISKMAQLNISILSGGGNSVTTWPWPVNNTLSGVEPCP